MSHNFGFRYARKQIKGSKEADFSLVSKKTWTKNGSLGWRPGPDKFGQRFENTHTCDVTHREPQIKKSLLSIEPRRLPRSVEGLNSSLALTVGELWPKNYRPSYWPMYDKQVDTYGAPFVKILYLTDLAPKLLSLRAFSYLCAYLAISVYI